MPLPVPQDFLLVGRIPVMIDAITYFEAHDLDEYKLFRNSASKMTKTDTETDTDSKCFSWLLECAKKYSTTPLPVAVVHPVDSLSLTGAVRAAHEMLITPILVGPANRIKEAAATAELDISDLQIIDTPHSHAAAERAVELTRSGEARAIMKGNLHTNELMSQIVLRGSGLRTDRRMSHVFLLETSGYPKPIIISDGALNISPDLMDKRWIVQNAIDAARAIDIDQPKVAILSATEEVDPNIPSTIDAAALCKMTDRGQISGGMLDGPLAFDLAVSKESASAKKLISTVAGDADILIVPSLESGNMLAKQLDYLAGASAAGLIMGAKVPIILTSRADSARERVASCAFAVTVAHRKTMIA